MFINLNDTIELDGFTIRAALEMDHEHGAPWEEDGHGPVSDWTARAKAPGELVLDASMGRYRYYDYDEACCIALRDGWDAAPLGTGLASDWVAHANRAAKAARADYERLRAWCQGGWYNVVVVTVSKAGIELGGAALGGVESDAGAYLVEVANELLDEAMAEARATLGRLAA